MANNSNIYYESLTDEKLWDNSQNCWHEFNDKFHHNNQTETVLAITSETGSRCTVLY